MSPLADTMGFVHGHQGDGEPGEELREPGKVEALGRNQEKLEATVGCLLNNPPTVRTRKGGIQDFGAREGKSGQMREGIAIALERVAKQCLIGPGDGTRIRECDAPLTVALVPHSQPLLLPDRKRRVKLHTQLQLAPGQLRQFLRW